MSADMLPLLTKALGETVYMVVVSMIVASLIGIPLGVLLATTAKGQILECLPLCRAIGAVVNALRSIPFIILMVAQLTTVIIALVGESAMAGAIGGGGLGDLAIRYGYQRFRPDIMIATVIILIVLVQIVQFLGNRLADGLIKK